MILQGVWDRHRIIDLTLGKSWLHMCLAFPIYCLSADMMLSAHTIPLPIWQVLQVNGSQMLRHETHGFPHARITYVCMPFSHYWKHDISSSPRNKIIDALCPVF